MAKGKASSSGTPSHQSRETLALLRDRVSARGAQY